MTPRDHDGRRFGRFNLVDGLVAAAIVVALPIGYAAFLLLRSPVPELTEVLPRAMVQGANGQVEIHGTSFRPYMRVSFGDRQGPAFYFVSSTVAVVPLPVLEPGTYDVILYDYSREVARIKAGLTLTPAPPPQTATLSAVGAFTGINDEWVRILAVGAKVGTGPSITMREVGAPVPATASVPTAPGAALTVAMTGERELPATIDLVCTLRVTPSGQQQCVVGEIPAVVGALIALPEMPGLRFRIDRLGLPR